MTLTSAEREKLRLTNRADRLVQWGKTAGPYSRLARGGAREGAGLDGRVDGHLRKTKLAGAKMLVELVLGEGGEDELIRLASEEGAGGTEQDNDRGLGRADGICGGD